MGHVLGHVGRSLCGACFWACFGPRWLAVGLVGGWFGLGVGLGWWLVLGGGWFLVGAWFG